MENVSDGYHTFGELYRYRMLYNAAFFNQLAKSGIIKTCKSYKHYDGEECFGGGWFIVMAELPTGQISNHYENQYWNLFNVPEQEKGFKWDGHSPNDAADRIEAYLKIKGDIVMQFDNSKSNSLLALIDPDGMRGEILLEGNPIEKIDIKILYIQDFTFYFNENKIEYIEYKYPDNKTGKVQEGSWIAKEGDIFYVLETDSYFNHEEECEKKDIKYVDAAKFDRHGGKDVFKLLGLEKVSLEEDIETEYAIITLVPSERVFGLKLKTKEGLVEVNNGDFVCKDSEGNFSVSEYSPVTVINSYGTTSIMKHIKKDIWNNPDDEVREAAKNFFGDKFKKVKTNVLLPFETILIHLKQGHVITRESWTDTVVFRQVPATIASDIVPKMQSLPDDAKEVIMHTGGISYNSQCLIYNIRTGVADSWCPTVDDILAEDWMLYKV